MSIKDLPQIVPAGDGALLVVLAEEISLEVNARVRALARSIESKAPPGVQEVVIALATLLVYYDPLRLSFEETEALVLRSMKDGPSFADQDARLREIPTVFGGPYGPDLLFVARYHKMAEGEVIRLLTGATYTVYMLGFAPGNPYLGGTPPELAMPRLESPRELVPAGTVTLAAQAGIHSLDSPGGWRWVGRTPIKMFDPTRDPPIYLQAGDKVRFIPIPEEEYLSMGGERVE